MVQVMMWNVDLDFDSVDIIVTIEEQVVVSESNQAKCKILKIEFFVSSDATIDGLSPDYLTFSKNEF